MNQYETMTDEQLICALRKGEEKITDYIMEKYKYLVKKKAKAMYLLGGENDDLIQEGMIGLFKAVRDFKPEQNTSFSGFAELCISRQLYTAIKLSQRQKHIPLNSYISIYENGEDKEEEMKAPLIERLQGEQTNDPEDIILDKEFFEMMIRKLKENLSDLESRVLYLHLMGEDYRQIAKLLDKNPKSIDNALQRIKSKVSGLL